MPSNVGIAIKTIREQKGLSQNQLAKKSGISQSAISSIESTTKSPSIDTVFEIASALGISITDLLSVSDGINKEKPTVSDGGLDEELVNLLVDLSPPEVQRAKDFVAGIKAARTKGVSPQR